MRRHRTILTTLGGLAWLAAALLPLPVMASKAETPAPAEETGVIDPGKLDVLDPGYADPYHYDPRGKRDPFQIPAGMQPRSEATPGADGLTPPKPVRKKEFLESFELDSLKLVATLFAIEQDAPVAMVEDPMGMGHVVRMGQYIGTNEGRITEIGDGRMVVTEPIPNRDRSQPTRNMILTLPREDSE